MPDAPTHEIVLQGRFTGHLLGPFLDDFTVTPSTDAGAETGAGARTRLVGTVRDTAHLHGLVAYLASVNAQVISIAPRTAAAPSAASPITASPITASPITDTPITDTPITDTPITDTRSTS